jgi:hypothetical protein
VLADRAEEAERDMLQDYKRGAPAATDTAEAADQTEVLRPKDVQCTWEFYLHSSGEGEPLLSIPCLAAVSWWCFLREFNNQGQLLILHLVCHVWEFAFYWTIPSEPPSLELCAKSWTDRCHNIH